MPGDLVVRSTLWQAPGITLNVVPIHLHFKFPLSTRQKRGGAEFKIFDTPNSMGQLISSRVEQHTAVNHKDGPKELTVLYFTCTYEVGRQISPSLRIEALREIFTIEEINGRYAHLHRLRRMFANGVCFYEHHLTYDFDESRRFTIYE